MSKIIGNTTATPNPRPDWNQKDETKADYIKNKPDVANALKGSASGNPIRLDDVSPLEHEIAVGLRSKNLFDPSVLLEASGWVYENGYYCGAPSLLFSKYSKSSGNSLFGGFLPNTQYTLSFKGFASESNPNGTVGLIFYYSDGTSTSLKIKEATEQPLSLTSTAGKTVVGLHASYNFNYKTYLKDIQLEVGTTATPYTPSIDVNGAEVKKYGKNLVPSQFVFSNPNIPGLTMTDNGDGTLSIKGFVSSNNSTRITKEIVLPAGTYCVSGLFPNDWTITKGYVLFNNEQIFTSTKVITLTEEKRVWFAMVFIAGIEYNLLMKPQIEVGTTATEWEIYKEPIDYTADENGKVSGIVGNGESMTLIADEGITVSAEYNKDTNKVIENLVNAIISLGGNV